MDPLRLVPAARGGYERDGTLMLFWKRGGPSAKESMFFSKQTIPAGPRESNFGYNSALTAEEGRSILLSDNNVLL